MTMYRYVIIKPDGYDGKRVHKKAPDWKEVQEYVGGSWEHVPYFSSLEYEGRKLNRGTCYANENGYVHGLRYNLKATVAWIEACPKGDSRRMKLMGTVFFVAKDKEATDGQTSVRNDEAS